MAMLDFIELAKSHTGWNMAEALVDSLNRYGIAHKVSISYICRDKKCTYEYYLDWLHYG